VVVEPAEMRFSADYGFRLLFALFARGKSTKKLMKIRARNLLIFRTQMMCKTDEELADLLRIPDKRSCSVRVQKPVENLRETGG